MRYSFTAKADADFQSIYRYIAEDNLNAAHQMIDKIEETCKTIAMMPDIGKQPGYVHDVSVRVFPVKKHSNYLIFYSQVNSEILILRVLNVARDLPVAFYD